MIAQMAALFYTFFKIGIVGFGGGYAMLSMIMVECRRFSITLEQFADLNALDMVIPGPIAINAATYVGYLYAGVWGAAAATLGVMLPSFILVTLFLRFYAKWKENHLLQDILSGVKPAAVGLIAAAAITIASGVLLMPGKTLEGFFADPGNTFSIVCAAIFVLTAALNIKYKVNPILLTVLAGIAGAFLAK
jgi:chromate transporter